MAVWGAERQEEAEVKYHSCFTLTFHPVPQAHGDLVIYAATDEEQIRVCPIAAHKHACTRLTHGGSRYAVASSLDRHSNRWLNLCLNETNEFSFIFFFCAPL